MTRLHSPVQWRRKIAAPTTMFRVTFTFLLLFTLGGCATTRTNAPFEPKSINDIRFRDRVQSAYDPDVRVSAAVPSAEESAAIFGADLARLEIQPIWIKIENHSDKAFYLVSTAVDPNYFSPNEASNAVRGGLSKDARQEMEYYFRSLAFRNPIQPNATVSGFIFTNLDEGEKVVQIDLISHQKVKNFTFFIQVPGMRVDYRKVDFASIYPDEEIEDLNGDELRAALENLPCCTTNKDGTEPGDPINLVVIGHFDTIAAAFVRRGWVPAEETYATAAWKTIKSYLFGSRYRYSPVSSLYFFDRHQDFARQKPRHNIHERNHLRLWYTAMRFEGKPVFVGQVSRDIGVRFTTRTWPPVTHKIDPEIDEARQSVIEDLLFSHAIAEFGFVNGVGRVTPSRPRFNLTGDPYFTDGLRAVLILESGSTSLKEIKNLGWENPSEFRFDRFDTGYNLQNQ